MFGPSGSGARRGAMYAIAQQQEGMNRSLGALDAGYNSARSSLEGAKGFLSPLYGTATQGLGAYADWAGAQGKEGLKRADDMFYASRFGRAPETGVQGVMRNSSRLGLTGSGNTMAALGEHLRDDEIRRYSLMGQALSPYNAMAPQLGSAMAGQQGALADLAMRDAQNRAGILTGAYNNMGQTGGNAFAASDQTRQQMTNLAMQGLSLGLSGLGGFLGGTGGINGLGNALGTLFRGGGSGGGGFYPFGYQ